MSAAVLEAVQVHQRFTGRRGLPWHRAPVTHAVQGMSVAVGAGQSLALVGESGCGKSTLARILVGLDRPSAGRVLHRGRELTSLGRSGLRELRRDVQYVFQDAASALNPRHTVGRALAVPLRALLGLSRGQIHERLTRLLDTVGVPPALLERYPHELSGGQAQRVVIARALAPEPRLLILDEPVSALDVSVQAQLLALLKELRRELGLAYLFISHDLAVVEQLCEQVIVMKDGREVERGELGRVFREPGAEYTRRLLQAVPVPGKGPDESRPPA